MFRLLFRFLGIVLIAGGFALAVVDGTRSIGAGKLIFMPFRALLDLASVGLPERLRPFIEALSPKLWDPFITGLLTVPAFVILWVIGFALYLISRPSPQKIGYSSR